MSRLILWAGLLFVLVGPAHAARYETKSFIVEQKRPGESVRFSLIKEKSAKALEYLSDPEDALLVKVEEVRLAKQIFMVTVWNQGVHAQALRIFKLTDQKITFEREWVSEFDLEYDVNADSIEIRTNRKTTGPQGFEVVKSRFAAK